jgi:hypothetical protein
LVGVMGFLPLFDHLADAGEEHPWDRGSECLRQIGRVGSFENR